MLAYETVIKDIQDGRLEVSGSELRDLQARQRDKQDSLKTAIVTAYRWVFHPGPATLDVVAVAGSATRDDTVAKRAVERLSNADYGTPKVMPKLGAAYFRDRIATRIWTEEGDPLELGELRRRFLQWTYLPILPDSEAVLRDCVRDGLNLKLWAVAIGDSASGSYTALLETPSDLDAMTVLFDGTAALVRGELLTTVRKQLQPEIVQPPEDAPEDPQGPKEPEIKDGKGKGQIPWPGRRRQRVRITLDRLGIAKTSYLQPYLFKVLQEQGAGAELSLIIEVSSEAGHLRRSLGQTDRGRP